MCEGKLSLCIANHNTTKYRVDWRYSSKSSRAAISKMRSFWPCNAALDPISETKNKKVRNYTNNYFIRLHKILWRCCLRIRTWIFYHWRVGWFDVCLGNKWGLVEEFKKVKQRLNLPPMTGKKTVASLRSLLTMWNIQRAAFCLCTTA